jgi:DNA (cytosine-5)-methyltransferase 1
MILGNEIVVDLFAGGGGASVGIKWALGRDPHVAVNHDLIALAMHEANHPDTWHLHQDVWNVPPRWATKKRPVGLLWASPDCTHFSKAKGGKPIRSKKIRDLAWVIERWASEVRPRVIIMENVEEFKTWGPLSPDGRIIDSQKGATFNQFVRSLKRLGYRVDWRELRACDYGAPTIRKRLFLIARCDSLPIIWPTPTHGPGRIPYRTAADIIDWSIPCPSIFERKKPLAENTLRRIAEGIKRYVIEAEEPFIVSYYGPKKEGEFRGSGINAPLPTQSTANRFGLVVPSVISIANYNGSNPASNAAGPLTTITANPKGGHHALVSAFLCKHYGGVVGHEIDRPAGTVTTKDHHSLVTSHLLKLRGTSRAGQSADSPVHTVTSGGNHIGEVRAFLLKYYGTDQDPQMRGPLHTVTTKDRFGLVTVNIGGEPYVITDIGMRMLSPRELFRAQGFPDDFAIDIEVGGKRITKSDQVRLCGNSVCPPMACALAGANMLEADLMPGKAASGVGNVQYYQQSLFE